jgi:CRP-like cAMP-binding protein
LIDVHLRKLRHRHPLSAEEESFVRSLVGEVREAAANTTIVRRGDPLRNSVLLLDGWVARQKVLPDGEAQISELHLAGDFVDLHGFTLKRLDHDLVALTRCRIGLVPHERLAAMVDNFPHLTQVYWFSTNLDAAVYREWTVSLGRRDALARTAHLFCELLVRHRVAGLAEGDTIPFPLTQERLSQCLGMTPVHCNRVLQELRSRGAITLEGRRLTIDDPALLENIAEFEPDYLFLDPLPLTGEPGKS